MAGNEFLFSFFGLLLGLAVANIANGFGDIWRSRTELAVGSATPLLGLLVLLCVSQQWLAFWAAKDLFDMRPALLLAAIGVAFPYIFIGSIMYPRDTIRFQSLDAYYLAHSRVLMVALLIPTIVNVTANLALGGSFFAQAAPYYAVRLGVPVALILWRRLWVHRIGLAILSVTMLVRIFN